MLTWTHVTITSEHELDWMVRTYQAEQSRITAAAFDTETTGLSHMRDEPFLYQFGWYCEDTLSGWTYAVDMEQHKELAKRIITMWHALVMSVPIYLGHNIKYDMHMEQNIGLPYAGDNISDNMIWIRLGSDALQESKGGAPLRLKDFAAQYISKDAKHHEKELKQERTAIAQAYNKQLQAVLNKAGPPPAEWGFKSWTIGCLDSFFKDKLNEVEDLPEKFRQPYLDWKATLPVYLQQKVTGYVDSDMIRYSDLNRETVIRYGHLDIVWTLESYRASSCVVRVRENMEAVRMEEANIRPLLTMERIGFKVDRQYLMDCKAAMKEYMRQRRADLSRMAGKPIKVSQSAMLLEVLNKEYGLDVTTTNAEELDRTASDLRRAGGNEASLEFIATLQELRTLEKWYSTYICRFLYELQFGDKIYTTINQTGTISGRVTSDFQQFPKDAITTVTGEELFCPRRMVVSGDDYAGIVYLDYSQIELRLQAMYTILVGHPDTNLCRAYMPYKCHTKEGRHYDYKDKTCIAHAYDVEWYYDEEPSKSWTPLDVHGATTKIAFNIGEDDPHYHDLRYKGKRVNFAKNYGAQYSKIKTMFPEYSEEQVHRIDDAYYLAFPGVKRYHEYCYKIANLQAYACNLFGVKYYGASGHNLINMLVQGTGAYFLKWKIVQVTQYLQDNGCKSKLAMQIHDELQFYWHKDDDPQIFFDIQKIMQDWDDTLVPIVADMELTKTTWKDKYEVHRVEDFYEIRTGH